MLTSGFFFVGWLVYVPLFLLLFPILRKISDWAFPGRHSSRILMGVATGDSGGKCLSRYWELTIGNGDRLGVV